MGSRALIILTILFHEMGPKWRSFRAPFRRREKTYFNAVPVRNMHLQFPKELGAPKGKVAHLLRCVYGTRDAGLLWEEAYARCLLQLGFTRGSTNPCCFRHEQRGLSLVVTETTLGRREDLPWCL